MGTAIVVVGITALACAYPGFRKFLFACFAGMAAVVVVLIALAYAHQSQEAAQEAIARQESAARQVEYERRVGALYQSGCAALNIGTDPGKRETCIKAVRQLCAHQSGTLEDCIGTITQRCHDPSTLAVCGEAALQAKHDAWCAGLERSVPVFIAQGKLRTEARYGNSLGFTEYGLRREGLLPINDCTNVHAAFKRLGL